jgi:hypothetical protein
MIEPAIDNAFTISPLEGMLILSEEFAGTHRSLNFNPIKIQVKSGCRLVFPVLK